MTPLGNHLWQSTVFAAVVALLAYALRHNRAQVRYWLWLAASVKFLVPFSLLVAVGGLIEWRASPELAPVINVAAGQASQSFMPLSDAPLPVAKLDSGLIPWLPMALGAIWFAGAVVLLACWSRRWWSARKVLRAAKPAPVDSPIPVLSSPTLIEPGVFGIRRPVLLLPDGIAERLTGDQLRAIVAHEACHVRRRDNLTAAIHMLVEALFWFHPLVWWIGARLIEERERACDEEVVAQGNSAESYAEGIVSVCKFYLQTPLACASGVSGADLRKRITEIMARRAALRLSSARKALLAAAAIGAVAFPVAFGLLRAQTLPPPPVHTYEVVSIRASNATDNNSRIGPGPQGGLRTQNTTMMQLLTFAYDVRDYQFDEVPGWVTAQRFDVSFTPDKPEIQPSPAMPRDQMEGLFNRHRQRMQAVLRDRLSLRLRADTRERAVYALTVARGGHKLRQPKEGAAGPHLSTGRNRMTGNGVYVDMVTRSLSGLVQRPVLNETGLNGPYDFELNWTPDAGIQPGGPDEASGAAEPGGGSIFTALTEQLGLRLERKRAPVTVFVVERIEKPTEN